MSRLCCLHLHIEIGASYPFSLHQRSPPTPFLTIKHTQYFSQIRSSKHSPLFLGESFWLLQSQGFTPREDKFDAHKCDFFFPSITTGLLYFHPVYGLELSFLETLGKKRVDAWSWSKKESVHVYLPRYPLCDLDGLKMSEGEFLPSIMKSLTHHPPPPRDHMKLYEAMDFTKQNFGI